MRWIAPLLVTLALAGCGGEREASPATPTPEGAEGQVRATFETYNAALRKRDFDTACTKLAPESMAKMREGVKRIGVKDPPQECDKILALVYSVTDKQPSQKILIEEIQKTLKVESVTVTGDTAKINWSAEVQGKRTPATQSARKIDGQWKLVDVTN